MASYEPTADWSTLRRRAELSQKLRSFFYGRGFLEVETPLLSADSIVDVHLEPFSVMDSEGRHRWLQTSPEFGMKRLLAAGATAIFQVTRAFRQGEQGRLHNPEFTMVEWYRVGDDMEAGVGLLAEVATLCLGAGQVDVVPYADVVREVVGVDPLAATDRELQEVAAREGLYRATQATRDDCLDFIFASVVTPRLGHDSPQIVTYFPASQAAMARISPEDPRCCERFELFARGVELANGYHELTDADEWIARAKRANRERRERGLAQIPVESRLLEAMRSGLPACAGTALGFDRTLMVALGRNNIRDVIAFPWDRA